MKHRKLVPAVFLLLVLAACTKTYTVHPGSISVFDSQTYDTLLIYHDAIESAKADLTSGQFPVSAKPVLNKFIQAYNVVQGAWVVYHQSANPNADTSALSAALTQAALAFTDLVGVNAKYKKPPSANMPVAPAGSVK